MIQLLFIGVLSAKPRWHLQRMVQRESLTKDQLESGGSKFNLTSISTNVVNVYVIDSGIRIAHEEFAPNRAIYGVNMRDRGSVPTDCDGHGTHVAGLAIGKNSGIATNARAISVRVLGCDGKGSCANILDALEYVMIDSSLRRKYGERSVAVMSVGSRDKKCAPSTRATSMLWESGVVITAAAGNHGSDSCGLYPAKNPHTIAVGATDKLDRLYKKNNYGDCIDVFAPGVGLLSAWGEKTNAQLKTKTGTSMATPLIAGLAAKILGADPALTADEVKEIIVASSTKGIIRTTDGKGVMAGSPNRLVYAPWARLFEEVEMNAAAPRKYGLVAEPPSFALSHPNWNRSALFASLSLVLRPKMKPAMHYSVIRIQRAVAGAAGIDADAILARRASGVQLLASSAEPSVVPLAFYIPLEPDNANLYMIRLIKALKNGDLENRSSENISFDGSSAQEAIAVGVSVPPAYSAPSPSKDVDRSNGSSEKGVKVRNIALICSGVGLLAVALAASLVLFFRVRRNRRFEAEFREASEA